MALCLIQSLGFLRQRNTFKKGPFLERFDEADFGASRVNLIAMWRLFFDRYLAHGWRFSVR